MKQLIITLVILANVCLLQAQNHFSKESLVQDFDKFVEVIEHTHPDPYSAFGGKMQFRKEALTVKNNIPQNGLDKSDFQNILSKFAAILGDGHTYISNSVEKSAHSKSLNIQFKILFDGLVVSGSEDGKYNGFKLTAVNGLSIDSLLIQASTFKPTENISGAYVSLVQILNSENQVKLIFTEVLDSKLHLAFITPEGKEIEAEIKYVDKPSIVSAPAWGKTKAAKPAPFWYSTIDDEKKVAYFPFYTTYSREVIEMQKNWGSDYSNDLNMLYRDYNLGDIPKDTEKAIKKIPSINETFFDMLTDMKKNKSTHLIIDLRQNGGGWTSITLPTLFMLTGDEYFNYECKAEYNTLISELYLNKNNKTIDEYNKEYNSNYKIGDYKFGYFMGGAWPAEMLLKDRRIKYFKDAYAGNNNGEKISGVSRLIESNGKPVYKPKVVVVCSPQTFSAAFHYMYFLKNICNATIVGVTSRQAYNVGMETTSFTLTNTSIQASVSNSFQLFFPQNMEKGYSLHPGYTFTWSDYLNYECNSDAEIMYVLDLIKNTEI